VGGGGGRGGTGAIAVAAGNVMRLLSREENEKIKANFMRRSKGEVALMGQTPLLSGGGEFVDNKQVTRCR
jgi:hypothetical protein